MKSSEKRWSTEHSRRFNDYYGTMRGYIRREVTRENLRTQLEGFLEFPRRVIDVGGGQGDDARWLAGQHHEVVLVEPDVTALAEARGYTYPVLEEIIQGTAETALAKYGPQSFDLVLSHGRLLYSDKPQQELDQLAKLISPGGYLSLLTAGMYGKINRFNARGEDRRLQQLLLSRKYVNELGLPATAYLPKELETFLERSGLETVNWFGVRIHTDEDDRPVESVGAFHRNRVLKEELRDSRDHRTRPRGQLLHYIARNT